MIPAIPKQLEKPILYGIGIAAAFMAYKLYTRGIAGTTSDIAGGVVKGVAGAIGGIVGGVVTATGDVVADGYDALPNAIKPTSHENLAYRATNNIGVALTGDKNFTFGGWIYDITH